MSMFTDLISRMTGRDASELADGVTSDAAAVPANAAAATPSDESTADDAPAAETPVDPTASTEAGVPVSAAAFTFEEIEATLAELAKDQPEELNWKHSIVDLLKLVGMESSYGARKELALELGYSESDIVEKGSAEMNIWLRDEVMKQLAARGVKMPA